MPVSSWIWIAASAASLGTATAPSVNGQTGPAVVNASAAVLQSSAYSWDTYKMRLGALARMQGVRESPTQTYIPGINMNNSAIQLA